MRIVVIKNRIFDDKMISAIPNGTIFNLRCNYLFDENAYFLRFEIFFEILNYSGVVFFFPRGCVLIPIRPNTTYFVKNTYFRISLWRIDFVFNDWFGRI